MDFYQIITPDSISKKNPLNPFPAGEIQLRNFLICRLLLNYGLRVSELLLLECHSIKPNLRGDQFSLIVTTVDDDVSDQRKRLPSLKNVYANRVLALDKLDFHFLNIYIHKIRPQASHSFLFTSTQRLHPPLSYHAVYDIFTRIDDIMSVQYPEYKKDEYYDAIESISPHITRHTLAYLTLQRLYREKLQKIKTNSHLAAIDFSIVGLMDEAKDELRLLGGWSHNSHMPDLYAKRFLSQQANYASAKCPAQVPGVLHAWSLATDHCITKSAFTFTVLKDYLDTQEIKPQYFYFIIFGLKILCTEAFPGFTLEDYEDLEFIPRPHSHDWGIYQEIDHVLDPLEK